MQVAASDDLTLRRPFSIAGAPADGFLELLVEVRGRGTSALAALPVGTEVRLAGPLGNAFTLPEAGESAVLVAGGIGAAGLRLLASRLTGRVPELHVLVGAGTRDRLLDHEFPGSSGGTTTRVEVSTDDGSGGLRGTVCELFARRAPGLPRPARVYCCGPPDMIRSAADIAIRHDLACELLLEEIMACGVGACRGCVVETTRGYRTVCADGPVFEARELVLEGRSGA